MHRCLLSSVRCAGWCASEGCKLGASLPPPETSPPLPTPQLLTDFCVLCLLLHTHTSVVLATGILRVMILSQLAPHRLTIAPEAPMPLAGLLEEVAAASHAADGEGRGEGLHGAPSTNSDIMGSKGISFVREPSISAAAGPAELGWEEEPGSLAVDLEQDASGMKEASSLQVCVCVQKEDKNEGCFWRRPACWSSFVAQLSNSGDDAVVTAGPDQP